MLPTGLTYSSLAKRRMPFMANGTCGVGRSVLPSSSRRAARRDGGPAVGTSTSSVSIPSRDSLEGALPRDSLTSREMSARVDVPSCRSMGGPSWLLADKGPPGKLSRPARTAQFAMATGTDVETPARRPTASGEALCIPCIVHARQCYAGLDMQLALPCASRGPVEKSVHADCTSGRFAGAPAPLGE